MRVAKTLFAAAALTALLAPGARADEWNKKTILTFSGPVQIPGVTLPAGSYVFKLADLQGNRHVVQVFDKDEKKIYTTMLAIPNDRLEPADKPIVLFSERASGSPQAVKVWFYPGERIGNEFVYPKTQAMRIAKDTHQSVLAMNNDSKMANTAGEIPVEAKSAALGRFDENGTWQSDSDKTVTMSNPPAAKTTTTQASTTTASTAPSTASGASAATTTSGTRTQTTTASKSGSRAQTTTAGTSGSRTQTSTAGTSGDRPARQHLPRTASSLALMELLSGLSIAGGFAARRLREYIS
jgi:hypothetical protein